MIYVNPWDLTEEAAAARYEKLARRLNDRMRTLEDHEITTDAMEQYQALVYDMSNGENLRLPSHAKGDVRTALNRVQDILDVEYATWKDIKEHALKGMATFEKEYGIQFKSVKQYHDFWRSETVKALKKHYGSGGALRAAETATTDNTKMAELAKEHIENDETSEEALLDMLGYGSETEALMELAEIARGR